MNGIARRYLRNPGAKLGLWVIFILLSVIPWADLQDHTHWSKVQWIPFVTPPVRVLDVVGNTLLYVPLGYWLRQASSGSGRQWRVLLFAAVLSLGTEWTQLYSHSRFPSMTDLTCNIVGAWCGARWAASGSLAEEVPTS